MKKPGLKKALTIAIAIILVIGISADMATLIHKKAGIPASLSVADGLSAYELAVNNGYSGTVQEWLDSLSGKSAYN